MRPPVGESVCVHVMCASLTQAPHQSKKEVMGRETGSYTVVQKVRKLHNHSDQSFTTTRVQKESMEMEQSFCFELSGREQR